MRLPRCGRPDQRDVRRAGAQARAEGIQRSVKDRVVLAIRTVNGMQSRREKLATGRPPKASARQWTIWSSRGAPRPGLENVVVEPLREDVSRAGRRLASEAASTENENDATPRNRQIRQAPRIAAMEPNRNGAAPRARTTHTRRPDVEDGLVTLIQHAIRRNPGGTSNEEENDGMATIPSRNQADPTLQLHQMRVRPNIARRFTVKC
jgi:hypothetical protein